MERSLRRPRRYPLRQGRLRQGRCGLFRGHTAVPEDVCRVHGNGKAYYRQGEYDRALNDVSEAIRLNPRLSTTYAKRGVIFERKGEYGNAIDDYTDAIRLDPKSADAYFYRGTAQIPAQAGCGGR